MFFNSKLKEELELAQNEITSLKHLNSLQATRIERLSSDIQSKNTALKINSEQLGGLMADLEERDGHLAEMNRTITKLGNELKEATAKKPKKRKPRKKKAA